MQRRVVAAMVVATAMATPARSQTIMDSSRQLRSTVRPLGGKPKVAESAQAHRTKTPSTSQAVPKDDGSMVPATVLEDDRSDTRLATSTLITRKVSTFGVRGHVVSATLRCWRHSAQLGPRGRIQVVNLVVAQGKVFRG